MKIFQSEKYINQENFNANVFKAYCGLIVEVLCHPAFTYYRYYSAYIITGNSEITVEFVNLSDFFDVKRDK